MKRIQIIKILPVIFFFIYVDELLPQAGQLDSTFGQNGIVTTAINVIGNGVINSTALQSDGKIIAAGGYGDFFLARYNPDGNLDNTFGVGGLVITKAGTTAMATSVAIQDDGKIVVVGYSSNGTDYDFTLARYNRDGSLDDDFGSGGIVITESPTSNDYINSIAIQPDGKIIAAGYSDYFGTNDFALARYNTNGEPDDEFGIDGVGILPSPGDDRACSVALQNDGKIIAAGFSDYYGNRDFALVRCNQNGGLDGTFGTGGIVTTDISGDDEVRNVKIKDSGEIIAVGNSYDGTSGNGSFTLICYERNGDLNRDFGTRGIVATNIKSFACATSAAIQSDGKIVAAGYSKLEDTYIFALARYNIDGTLDFDFGTGGIVIFEGSYPENIGFSVLIQNNRKIVAAGYTADSGHKYFALIRYHENGIPDNSFGRDGMVTTHIGGARNIARSTAIQTDGKIIVAGITFNGSDWDAALTRYNTDGRLDSTFGINGIVTAGGPGDEEVYSVAFQPDGGGSEKIIVAGYSDESGNPHFMLIRFSPNGIIDSSFGTAGIVITPIGVESEILSSTIQENGKVIAAGYSFNGSDCDFIIARYNQDGNLDNNFGVDGIKTTDIGANDRCYSAIIQSDGKIIAAGTTSDGTNVNSTLIRYDAKGDPDTSFGIKGVLRLPLEGVDNGVSSVAIQNVAENSTAGKILLAGDMDNGSDHDFFLARYNANGQLDKNFGEDGFVTTGIYISSDDYASSVAVQNNGKIVVAGSALKIDGSFEFALIRYNIDGTLDNTFGTSGIVTTSIGTSNCLALSSAIQEDGKIIVVGRSGNSSYNYFVFTIVRYEGDSPATLKTEKSNEELLSYKLDQNYPNPFNPATNIEFRIPNFGFVTLKVYDVLGREVATLVNGEKSPGAYKVKFNAQQTINNKQLSSGIYFYRLKCGDFVRTKKMILLR